MLSIQASLQYVGLIKAHVTNSTKDYDSTILLKTPHGDVKAPMWLPLHPVFSGLQGHLSPCPGISKVMDH